MKKREIIYVISLVCIIIGSLFTVIQQPIRVGVDDIWGRIVVGKKLRETESSRNEENMQTANRKVIKRYESNGNEISENKIKENEISKNNISKNEINGNEIGENEIGENEIGENEILRNEKAKDAEHKTRVIDPGKKLVALTFDDGPSEYTKRILRTLKQYDSVATFFVVGNRVELFEDVLKEELEIGCEIGNHTYEHKVLTELNAEQIWLQIYRTNEAVKKVTGEYPTLMRPPCGYDNGSTNCIIAMPLILWSVDTKDWQTQNCYCSVQTVLENVKDGDIILMHDMYEASAEAVETIVPSLIAEGYQLVTVSELAEYRGMILQEGEEYSSFKKE